MVFLLISFLAPRMVSLTPSSLSRRFVITFLCPLATLRSSRGARQLSPLIQHCPALSRLLTGNFPHLGPPLTLESPRPRGHRGSLSGSVGRAKFPVDCSPSKWLERGPAIWICPRIIGLIPPLVLSPSSKCYSSRGLKMSLGKPDLSGDRSSRPMQGGPF